LKALNLTFSAYTRIIKFPIPTFHDNTEPKTNWFKQFYDTFKPLSA